MGGFVDFPIESNSIQLVDGGQTKVFLVAFHSGGVGDVFLNLEGTFSGDDKPKNKCIKNDMVDVLEILNYHDIYDSYYFPYMGTCNHNKSIPFQSILHLSTFDKTIEYLDDIYPWTCKFNDLSEEGRVVYINYVNKYKDCEIRLLTMANI